MTKQMRLIRSSVMFGAAGVLLIFFISPAYNGQKSEQTDPASELLLPDLQVKINEGLRIEPDSESGAKEIRFDTTVSNHGDGALDLFGTYDEENKKTRATQKVLKKDGNHEDKIAGFFSFHPAHDHWHFEDFAQVELFTYESDKRLTDRLSTTGKITFCIHDREPLANIPNTPPQPVYSAGCESGVQGLSVGWVDIYNPGIPGQELNIDSVPDGNYALVSTVDPQNRIVESNEKNNMSIIFVEIKGNEIRLTPAPIDE